MRALLLATTNAGKIREIRRALDGVDLDLSSLADHPPVAEPAETETTFEGNAALKAVYYARQFPPPVLAEDSGLVIDALDGRPGVTSARYPGATYADKFANLYRELASHPRPWTARFVSVLALATTSATSDTPALQFWRGVVEGEIAPEPRGRHGFGYDPIFFVPALGSTTGEMTDEQKLAISHRGRALRAFRAWLTSSAPSRDRAPSSEPRSA